MAMPRNNIARLPWEIREVVCRLRFDGAGNAAIGAAVRDACRTAGIPAPKVHGTTILAYTQGAEYRQYCDRRRAWDERMAPRRWAASLLNSGQGPQTVADLAEMAALEQLHAALEGGEAEPRDTLRILKALIDAQRLNAQRRAEDYEARIAAIETEHAAAIAELERDLAEARAEIERLRNGGTVDLKSVADRMDKLLGGGN